MVNGFYLVSRDENKAKEVDIFRRLNPGVGIELVCFEDIIPMAADDGMLYLKGEKVACPDFVFVRAFKTRGKESQFEAVMNTLENLGAVCVNPIEARRMTTDKLLCFQVVRSKVPEALVPKTMLVTADVDAETVGRIIGFPLVLKVMHGSKGLGVTLVKDEETLDAILNTVLAAPLRRPAPRAAGDHVLARQRRQGHRRLRPGHRLLRTCQRGLVPFEHPPGRGTTRTSSPRRSSPTSPSGYPMRLASRWAESTSCSERGPGNSGSARRTPSSGSAKC
jgi:hypothetical protein